MVKSEWSCLDCIHFYRAADTGYPVCDSFQSGIPWEIMAGLFDHRKPWPSADDPQDGGARFEPVAA